MKKRIEFKPQSLKDCKEFYLRQKKAGLSSTGYVIAKMYTSRRVDMVDLNPQIIEKDGNKEFVILPYEEFVKLQDELADYEDLRVLREAKLKEADAPTIGLKDAKKELNLE